MPVSKNRCIDKLRLPVALAYMAIILWMSSVPGVISEDATSLHRVFLWVPPGIQNLLHVPVYAGLAVAWGGALSLWLSRHWWIVGGAFFITVSFGIADECYQSFIPGRFASVGDILANALGAFIGVGFYSCIRSLHSEESGARRARLRPLAGRNRG